MAVCQAARGIARPFFAVAVILFLIQSPYVISEPMLRVRKYFAITAVGRALPSIFTLAIIGVGLFLLTTALEKRLLFWHESTWDVR